MTRLLARRLRAVLASAVSLALIVLSPGLEASRVFAQELRATPVEGVAPAVPLAPALSVFAVTPSAATVAYLPSVAAALTPRLAAAADAAAGASAAYDAGRGIEDELTGARSVAASAAAPALNPGVDAAPLAAAVGKAGSGGFDGGRVPAAGPALEPGVDSAAAYKVRRMILATAAALTGGVYSLPTAGPALTDALIARAADRRAVLSDYDDTLAPYNQRLPEDMVEAVQAVRAAGKTFDVISDRGDEPRPNQLTVFDSLDTLPVATRAGMYVAANSGGRVYLYGEDGVPTKVYEAPAMSDAVKADVAAAAEATKRRLAEVGAEQHDGAIRGPAESWGPYGYALMLKPGSSEASVRGAAAILQQELDRRGVEVEVMPRFAKDPANPPYITFSMITKAKAAAYIAKARGAAAEDVLILGDSQFSPVAPKRLARLARLAARAGDRVAHAFGNRTDANMEKGVPGALTLSVGGAGDPRTKNLYVLSGKGPSVTLRVLRAVASKPAGAPRVMSRARSALDVAAVVALLATVGGAYVLLAHGFVALLQGWENTLQDLMSRTPDFVGVGMLGAFASAPATREFAPSLAESISRQSPVDGFSTFVYARALESARELAAKAGYRPDNLRFTDAVLYPRAWGEDWRFFFVSPRQDALKGPREFGVTVRRTMVSETQLDAIAEDDLGPVSLFSGVPAAAAPELLKLTPMEAVAKTGADARTLSVEARWRNGEGPAQLWYVARGEKGRELMSIHAGTGEVLVPRPYAALKRALAVAGLFALTFGIYALIYYGLLHAPAAVDPNALPNGGDWNWN
ncbi:MAG: hypothetical protein HKL90_00885 [Elusimicrobia bacterium]|nr:hypothetical protein [Elusimicrobiota bacterium]